MLSVLVLIGCSKAVELPRDQIANQPESHIGYRIQMVDGSRYSAKRYSVTDSTLVIEKLNPSDSRYKKVSVPIALPITSVQSVSKLELKEGASFAVVATFGVIMIMLLNPPEFPAD